MATTEQRPPIPEPLFVDIETVPAFKDFPDNTPLGDLFLKQFRYDFEKILGVGIGGSTERKELEKVKQELWHKKASVTAEYGKIVCISVGKVIYGAECPELYVKTLFDLDEQKLLLEFRNLIMKRKDEDTVRLCAHNGKEFDFPWLFRRMIVNKVIPPSVLNHIAFSGKKVEPYNMRLDDTMEMWSGTQWKHMASIALLTEIFGLETPKGDMDGSMVAEVYYSIFKEDVSELPFDKEDRIKAAIKRISDYCAGDIVALVNMFCVMKGYNTITKVIHAA